MRWAQRLKRVFNIDIEICSACGSAMKLIACIEDPIVIKQIFDRLKHKDQASESGAQPESRAPPAESPTGCLADEPETNGSNQKILRHRRGRTSLCRRTGLALIDGEKDLSEVPSSQTRSKPKALKHYEASSADRNIAIVKAYRSGGYTLKEIGEYFHLHYSTVSGIIRPHESKT